MRCFIYYKRGGNGGKLELDVSGARDPRIDIERAKLERLGAIIYRVEVW